MFGFFPSPILFTFGSSLQGAVQASSSNLLLLAAASNLLNLKPEKHVVGWDSHIRFMSPVLTAPSRCRICIRPLSAVSLFSVFHDHFSVAAMNLPGSLRVFAVLSQKSSSDCTLMKGSSVPGSAGYRMQQGLSLIHQKQSPGSPV